MKTGIINPDSIPRWIDGLIEELQKSYYSTEKVFEKYVDAGILQFLAEGRYHGDGFVFDIMKHGIKSDVVLKNYPDVIFVQNVRIDKGFIQITRPEADIPMFTTGGAAKDKLLDSNLKFRVSDIKIEFPQMEFPEEKSLVNIYSKRAIAGMRYVLANKTEIYARCSYCSDGVIRLSSVVSEGDRGDSDGFGMEDDEEMIAYMNPHNGNMTPFVTKYSAENELYRYMIINNMSLEDIKKSGLTKINAFDY